MSWYIVSKRINGRSYLYRQRTYRVAGHVKTDSQYIGPEHIAGTSVALAVKSLDQMEPQSVPVVDDSVSPIEHSLIIDFTVEQRSGLSTRSLTREEENISETMRATGLNTTNLKHIYVTVGKSVDAWANDDGYFAVVPDEGKRTEFKHRYRQVLAERWLAELREQQPETYSELCATIRSGWSFSSVERSFLQFLSDWWHSYSVGHQTAREMMAEMIQRGPDKTIEKYEQACQKARLAQAREWKKFCRLKRPKSRKKQYRRYQRAREKTRRLQSKLTDAVTVRRIVYGRTNFT